MNADNKKWAKKYNHCIECGKNDSPHRSKGLCRRCYYHNTSVAYHENQQKYVNSSIIGERFGRLTVLRVVSGRKHHYICKCDCGNEIVARKYSLFNGLIKSCKCLHKEAIRLQKGAASFNKLYSQYKKDAIRRRLLFELSKEEFNKLTSSNCYYCGKSPSTVTKQIKVSEKGKRHGFFGNYIYNGIDRKDSKKGYAVDNCMPCCNKCNFIKQLMSIDEFRNWVLRVHANFILKNGQ